MRVLIFLLSITFPLTAICQDWAKVPTQSKSEMRLNVGDHIPFTELHNVVNYTSRTMKLSEHKPKLIILDFWETTCSPCIKFWPTATKLQEQFGKDLLFILVNRYQSAKTVEDFFNKRKAIDGARMNLPAVCRDSTIWKNFPIRGFPRYVWINGDGVVGSITDGKEVTADNIKKWIASGPFPMTQTVDKEMLSITPWNPIFVNGNGGQRPGDAFVWSSSLTQGQVDIGPGTRVFYDSIVGYGIISTRTPILTLYGQAYNNRLRDFDYWDYLPLGRMQLIAKDTSYYYWDGNPAGNTYNYQLISGRPKSKEQLLSMMKQDLYRYFGLDVKWEKQKKKCYVLSMFDSTRAKRKSLGAEIQVRDGKIVFDSVSIKGLTTALEMGAVYYRAARYPIVDETDFKGRITGLRETGNINDPVYFDKILSKYGMRMKLEMREVDVLVLTESDIPATSR